MRIPVLGKTGVLWRFSLKRGPRLEGSCELRLAQQCRVPCTQELQHPLYPQAQDWASSHLPPPCTPFVSIHQRCQAAANSCLANHCSQLGPAAGGTSRGGGGRQLPHPDSPISMTEAPSFLSSFIFPVSLSLFVSRFSAVSHHLIVPVSVRSNINM